ncbi:serine hydrolase [Celeribacter baekdonensis]|mgnify:CR=1 FL=1|uniref:serine hydrolase n=1 Tax=Celeribacter baekdonensis TaxID=875171 RepID=UPI0030D95374|tara:strand:- start:110149 stop:111084 length:936 start_codon:yes stop_codon:yes gene_type:complete
MFLTQTQEWTRRGAALMAEMQAHFDHRGLRADAMGLVVFERGASGQAEGFAWRGDWPCYPCSLVKAFHLVHGLSMVERAQIAMHADLDRALRDMILWSSNTATNYVIDLVTGTTGDTLLSGQAFDEWRTARERLNGFFTDLGWAEFAGCNLSQKLMDDTRYGREAQYAGADGAYLNVLTPLSVARLMWELFEGDVPLSGPYLERARGELSRVSTHPEAKNSAYQLTEFLGGGLPDGTELWSKAGHNLWTGALESSYFKHDMLRWVRPDGRPIYVVLMTKGQALAETDPQVFPDIGQLLYARLNMAEPVEAL